MSISKLNKITGIVFCILTVFAFCFVMSGCESQEEAVPEEDVDYEIALVTDEGLVMDGGHSEVAWNTIVDFGGTNGISHKYYKAAEPTDRAFEDAIRTAINKGAKLVIIDNSSMQEVAYAMQKEYPEISFVMTEAEPYDENGDIRIEKNTIAVAFDSGQAGFLAGYAAVNEGYTNLGYIGQDETDENKGFGYGFVKGANRAARELGVSITIRYRYCRENFDQDNVRHMAYKMYSKGVECIFAGGGNIQVPVIDAAEAGNGKVIGSITDQSSKSDTVITSAIYNISDAVKTILREYKDDELPGGDIVEYNAYNDGIGLELKNNRLNNLQQDQYDAIYNMLAKGEIKVRTDKAETPKEIRVQNVTFE